MNDNRQSPCIRQLKLDELRLDGEIRAEDGIGGCVVDDYAKRLQGGSELPPVVAYFDGSNHWLADGFHRWHAHRKTGRNVILCEVRQGTLDDARWFSYSADATCGSPRRGVSKAMAVKSAIRHPNGARMSDLQVAQYCGIDYRLVTFHRIDLEMLSGIPNMHDQSSYAVNLPVLQPLLCCPKIEVDSVHLYNAMAIEDGRSTPVDPSCERAYREGYLGAATDTLAPSWIRNSNNAITAAREIRYQAKTACNKIEMARWRGRVHALCFADTAASAAIRRGFDKRKIISLMLTPWVEETKKWAASPLDHANWTPEPLAVHLLVQRARDKGGAAPTAPAAETIDERDLGIPIAILDPAPGESGRSGHASSDDVKEVRQ